ncbi:MAG: oligosaccharide flippase family protein [Oscillospiraceae bacterium]|nr:oligosaccharide flippase family protein [Oscillospiraceae bacterium]
MEIIDSMKIDRKRNAIAGTFTGVILKIFQILVPFIIRTIFIRTLGIDYLGLNSLFTSILQVLNLAELGVSSALVFSMYKPIAEDDHEKICQLMNLYKVYYRIIGLIVLGLGLILLPFLPKLISGDVPSDINIYVIYLMNLASTVLSYWLFAYRNSLFTAHQRNDIVNTITVFTSFTTYALQIVALLTFKNYYLYLAINIFGQILLNIVTAIASKKFYPQYKPEGRLPKEERKAIMRKVRDLFTAKVGGVINNSADTIVISAFIGLELVAIYQNYYYIVSSIMAFFTIFFSACTAGIGNSLIVRGEEENRQLLFNINHINFMALNFCCTSLVCLYQPFMKLWVGEEYMLDFSFVILFALYLFAEEISRPMIQFKDAGGIWKEDRFRPLTAAIVNLTLNLILVQFIGLYGIVISTIASILFIAFPWLVYNINKCMFRLNVKRYLMRFGIYAIVIIFDATVTYLIANAVTIESGILTLVFRAILCIIVPNALFMLFFSKTKENRYLVDTCMGMFKKLKRQS